MCLPTEDKAPPINPCIYFRSLTYIFNLKACFLVSCEVKLGIIKRLYEFVLRSSLESSEEDSQPLGGEYRCLEEGTLAELRVSLPFATPVGQVKVGYGGGVA